MLRNLSSLLLPLIVLLLSWLLLSRAFSLSPAQQELLTLAPYLLAAAALISGYHFKRGRVCLLIILATVNYYLGSHYLAAGTVTPEANLVYRALAILLPFNLLVIALMREKGITGCTGRMRLTFLGGQLFLLWLTLHQGSQALWMALTHPLLQLSLLASLPIPQLSLLMLVAAAGITLWKAWQRPAPVEGALFGVVITFAVLLAWPAVPFVTTIFSGTASLILVLAIIQDSHNMAFRDDMTGLPSRRALNELLRGLGSRYAIAMVDVDHFKRFNDTYGHDVGDQVLKVVAGRLMAVSGGGRPFRYGGEEFTVIFPGKSAKDAAPHLERLRKAIEEYKMALRSDDRPKDDSKGQVSRNRQYASRDVSVTVSIGVAESGSRYTTAEEVIRAADSALYRAKNGGRNQVCLAGQR
ncbi:GGDEF domain-containing protein [Trichlorobacter lovleyi]|uniref:diguanylate cyclase n=1 Tax=Trichlorobacter lovleyi (strain ATCC BAA-1151 / DSM 17278 / SZ) TaxID=398767 RepID=B3E945_TRIL1|nr:GGDEF domain-containing protein [Trichlorobacter lovleyi]ACD96758.1 diguanylate cyclase [Trichlorobacter lovleyi SZ]QOX80035.1 GGDEF domain-containing protein [Trichlorobacter lovleyi]